MQKKPEGLQVHRQHAVCVWAHSRWKHSDLSRRINVNPRLSTKQRSDVDRRASFSILCPAP